MVKIKQLASQKNNKFDLLLITGLTSNLFYSIAYPVIHTICINDMNSKLVSFSSLLSCILATIVINLWLKYSDSLYKTFGISLLLEGICFGMLTFAFIIGKASPATYYLIDCILTATLTRNVISAGNRLKAIRYKDQEREIFDNKTTMYCNIASILGFGFSSLIALSTNIAFVFMWVGISIDNIFYYIVYREENKNYIKDSQ